MPSARSFRIFGGRISKLAIDIHNLNIKYGRSPRKAVDALSLQIERGSFFGLLGPNGAGKTTLISFLCGQISGEFERAVILGCDRHQIRQYKEKLGYAPQEIAVYPTLSARENLRFFARILSLPQAEVDRVLDWTGLSERADEPVMQFSGGMKRRLNLGVALLNQPELLILDEPTVGVDPQSRNFIFERILELRAKGVTLIYSSHYLEEVKKLCTHVGVMREGTLRAVGRLEDVLGSGNLEERFLDLTGYEVE